MKRFLILTGGMMVLVLLLAVAAFVYVQLALAPAVPEEEAVLSPGDGAPAAVPQSEAVESGEEPVVAAPDTPVATEAVPTLSESIPLSSLPLSDTQKDLLRGAGIDPETFVITPEMVTCAEDRLGATRFAEIVAGDTPGPTEVFSLLRCL